MLNQQSLHLPTSMALEVLLRNIDDLATEDFDFLNQTLLVNLKLVHFNLQLCLLLSQPHFLLDQVILLHHFLCQVGNWMNVIFASKSR